MPLTQEKAKNTPCVGVCSTIYGDEVCRGCKRYYREVIAWNSYNTHQKAEIFKRLHANMEKVLDVFIEVKDSELLQKKLTKHQIAYHPDSPMLCRAYALLRQGAEHIQQLSRYGIHVRAAYVELNPQTLFNQIDSQLFELAVIEYQKS